MFLTSLDFLRCAHLVGSRAFLGLLLLTVGFALAVTFTPNTCSAQERPDRQGTPDWELPEGFPSDIFVFTRLRHTSLRSFGPWGFEKWRIDWPDAEINLSFRLQQLTSIRTHPDGKVLSILDDEVLESPFLYMVEPGDIFFEEAEAVRLREHLLNGGFLMFDDFWGDREWNNFAREMKKVFPNRDIVDLEMDHPIFHCVFEISKKPQVPNVRTGHESQWTHITWEERSMPGAKDPHYRAIFDDRGRMMVMICHNTDNGDGWEREGESEYFFREFSEKQSYPLGINVLFYAMTH